MDKKQDKIGLCKLCGEKGENTVIKMSDTSGLIRHLSAKHEKQFQSYFPKKNSRKNDAQGNRTIIHLFNKEDKDNAEPLSHQIFYMNTDEVQPIRAKVSPIFTPSKLKSIVPLLLQRSEIFKDWLDTLLLQNEQINYSQVTAKYTADLSATCLFGYDMQTLGDGESKVLQYIKKKMNANKLKIMLIDLLPDIVIYNKLYDLLGYYMFNNAEELHFFTELVKDIDGYRKKYGIVRHDITDAVMKLQENGKLIKPESTNNFIAANMFAFFFAAYETSSVTMTHTMYELAVNQSIQDRLRKEIKSVRAANNRKKAEEITYDDINTMSYLDAVFKETLRKYPVIELLKRQASSAYTFRNSKVTIPKNQLIGIPVHGIHYNSEIYPKPEVYDPERFMGEAAKSRPSMYFLPFGHGPRNCIGERFGILQTKISLITIVENYKIDTCENTQIVHNKEIIVQQTARMYLKLTKIN
ncbi:probable cytochrome P450 6a17 isoform X2 [Linepithema humile]|uniref:probable cytochrome P450 6a17 isoform X2 n=1 Tax=Linepithema humile TaxID=83485 RepID=UPI00351F2BD3